MKTKKTMRKTHMFPDLSDHPDALKEMPIKSVIKLLHEARPEANITVAGKSLTSMCAKGEIPTARKNEKGVWLLTPIAAVIAMKARDDKNTKNRRAGQKKKSRAKRKVTQAAIRVIRALSSAPWLTSVAARATSAKRRGKTYRESVFSSVSWLSRNRYLLLQDLTC